MTNPVRQTSWGWVAAAHMFMAALGGGTFLFCYILGLLGMYEPITRTGAVLGPVLVLIDSFFLLGDLGSRRKVYRLFFNPSTLKASWMAKGVWIMTLFIIFGLAYAFPSFDLFEWLPYSKATVLGKGIGVVAAVLAALVVMYPGFVLAVVKGIPLWNTSALPLLFILSALYTAIALFVLLALFFPRSFGAEGVHKLAMAEITLILVELTVMGAYLEISRRGGLRAMASLHLLRTPLFIGGAILGGLLVPFGLLLYSIVLVDPLSLRILAGVTSVFLLAGGLLLRYSVIKAGVYLAPR